MSAGRVKEYALGELRKIKEHRLSSADEDYMDHHPFTARESKEEDWKWIRIGMVPWQLMWK